MSGRVFWLTAALLLGIAVHLSYILFVPRLEMDARMSQFSALAGTNKLAVVKPGALKDVFPEADPALAHAVCVFDLSAGPVLIKAKVPTGYWLVSFYAPNGDSFYSLNSRQADVRSLDLVIVNRARASDKAASPLPQADSDKAASPLPQADSDNQVTVRSPAMRGLVLLRARIPAPALRARIEADLTASTCGHGS